MSCCQYWVKVRSSYVLLNKCVVCKLGSSEGCSSVGLDF